MSDEKHQDGSFFIGLFLGGLVGALIIVLLGTEKGKKLAHKLETEGLDFLKDNEKVVKEKVEEIQEKGEELIEKGKELVTEGKELQKQVMQQVVEVKDDVVGEASTRADQTLEHIEKLQEQGREATAQLRKRLFKNIPSRKIA